MRRSPWISKRNVGLALGVAMALALGAAPASAGKKKTKPARRVASAARYDAGGACSQSANALFAACHADIVTERFAGRAICLNVADPVLREDCFDELEEARAESAEECGAQLGARLALCDAIGEAPYEPDMDPALFQDPRNPATPNPWFPLGVGNRWVFDEGDERIEIEVRDETKRIAGVDCIVVNDRAFEDDVLVEDTDDWFGLRTDGGVEYCGELARDYEVFEGDDPEAPQLVSIDGSFKAGVDGAKSGTLFLGAPVVGAVYRQEWSAGNAEDVGTVLSTTYRYGENPFLDQAVPQALAELFCADGDCVVVADTSTLEPDAYEHKYFARGVGLFLETEPESGGFVPLIECSHDARCASLPLP